MAPTAHDVEVAIEVLRSDASAWDAASESLKAMEIHVATLTLGLGDLGTLCETAGLVGTYGRVQEHIDALLGQGVGSASEVGSKLLIAANMYEGHEREKAERLAAMKTEN